MSGAATSSEAKSGTESSQTSPWQPQQQYLTSGFSGASNALNTAGNNAANTSPTGFVAGLTPDQIANFQRMAGYNTSAPGMEAGAGGALTNAGMNATTGALNGFGSFDPYSTNNTDANIAAARQYMSGLDIPGAVKAAMQPAMEQARDVTMPGIDANAAGTGNINSSRTGVAQGLVQRGLAENAQNLTAQLTNDAYTNGLNLASGTNQANNAARLAALQGAAGAGTSAAGTGLGALSSSIGDAANQFNINTMGGAGQQAGNQATYDNQNQAYQFGQQSPFQALQQYFGLIGGNYGSQTSGTSTANSQTTPSMMQIIGSLLGAGGSALGSKGGVLGGGSGILGMFK